MKSSITDLRRGRRRQPRACALLPAAVARRRPTPTSHAARQPDRRARPGRAAAHLGSSTAATRPGGPTPGSHDQVAGAPRSLRRRLRPVARRSTGPPWPSTNEQHKLAHQHRRASKCDRTQAERRRADARNQLHAAAQRRRARPAPPTSTPTATSPARASCPATPSRACRWPPTSRPGAAARPTATTSSAPASWRSASSDPDSAHLPRGRPLRGHPRPAAPRPRRHQRRRRDHRDRQALRGLRLPPPGRRSAPTCARTAATPLGATQYGLLRLQTVFTRRRERISSDEEERRRVGLRARGLLPVRRPRRPPELHPRRGDAATARRSSSSTHGDAAEIRIANVGRRRRKNPADRGFWLDLREGRWLTDKQAADATVDTDDLARRRGRQGEGEGHPVRRGPPQHPRRPRSTAHRRRRRSPSPCAPPSSAAIEAEFQLEDSELDSRELPDPDERGRMLLTEAAEGGAGVLRRLVDEPDALARVARTALRDHPLRPRHRRRPRPRRRRPRALRARLLRLPALLRQPVRARRDRPAQRRARPAAAARSAPRVAAGAGGRGRADQRDWLDSARATPSLETRVRRLARRARGRRLPDDAQRHRRRGAAPGPTSSTTCPATRSRSSSTAPHHDDAAPAAARRARPRTGSSDARLDASSGSGTTTTGPPSPASTSRLFGAGQDAPRD